MGMGVGYPAGHCGAECVWELAPQSRMTSLLTKETCLVVGAVPDVMLDGIVDAGGACLTGGSAGEGSLCVSAFTSLSPLHGTRATTAPFS